MVRVGGKVIKVIHKVWRIINKRIVPNFNGYFWIEWWIQVIYFDIWCVFGLAFRVSVFCPHAPDTLPFLKTGKGHTKGLQILGGNLYSCEIKRSVGSWVRRDVQGCKTFWDRVPPTFLPSSTEEQHTETERLWVKGRDLCYWVTQVTFLIFSITCFSGFASLTLNHVRGVLPLSKGSGLH